MPVESGPLTLGLAFLIPIGYALIAAAGLSAQHVRHAAVSFFAAVGLAVLGYVVCGLRSSSAASASSMTGPVSPG